MKGRVCIVTGANAGIGRVTALELARLGATVVLVCRSQERGAQALAEIRQLSNNQDVHLLLADLSSIADTIALAGRFRTQFDRLDILVNNAGAYFTRRLTSADNLEMTFALNHMGYFVLTTMLLDILKTSGPARIINVSSDAHRGAKLDFDDLQAKKQYSAFRTYGRSKLANVLFTYELARRLENQSVTVNALHPGFVASNFATNNGGLARLFYRWIVPLIALTPEKGAETAIFLASSPVVEGVTGQYFYQKNAVRSSPDSYDETAARRLWAESQALMESLGGRAAASPI